MATVNPVGQAPERIESVGPLHPDARPESSAAGETVSPRVLGPQIRHWRRRLATLAWVALDQLAIATHPGPAPRTSIPPSPHDLVPGGTDG
jgi:hypothetical protein